MHRLVVMVVLVACRSSESFTIGPEVGPPKPYEGLSPSLSLAEAKRRVPALATPERVDPDGTLRIDQNRLVVRPTRDGAAIDSIATTITQDQADVLTKTWGSGEVIDGRSGRGPVWFDARRGVLAHLVGAAPAYTLHFEDFIPFQGFLAKGRPTWFAFEHELPVIGTRYERYVSKLEKRDDETGRMVIASTEWSIAGTEVDVYAHAGVIHGVTVWFRDRADHDLVREIDAVWGPHAIDLVDAKPVPVWRDPAANRRARFLGGYITVDTYQPFAKTLELAASLVGARRSDLVARNLVNKDGVVTGVTRSEFQDLASTFLMVTGDPTTTSVELSEGASSYADRAAILKALSAHYKVPPIDVQAAATVIRERAPRVVAGYRPGIGEHGLVTVTFTP